MFVKSVQILTCASIVGLLASGYAGAQVGSASTSVSMRATVPLVCRVSFTPGTSPNLLGIASQLCNNPTGYTLHALATGDVDGAFVIVDNRRIALIPGQEVLILASDGPARKDTLIGYEPSEGSEGGNLTLRIEAN
jgi:hypothetical protein